MPQLEIHQFPCLSDNFGVLIHDATANVTASIDAPEAAAVRRALAEKGWRLTHILTTHHHADHVGGNEELKAETGCTIVGPKGEAGKIPGIDVKVGEGDRYTLGGFEVQVLDTPGHTIGHITYWIPAAKVAFVGDTLFAMGCGRILEGDARMMWTSLGKLMKLPRETVVYCGHEYTVANGTFAVGIEPGNTALAARLEKVKALRAAGKPTLPTTIGEELETNPFLRAPNAAIRKHLGMAANADWEVFGEVRERKNRG